MASGLPVLPLRVCTWTSDPGGTTASQLRRPQLETVSELYAGAFGSKDFLTTTIFEFRGGASLSWTLE